MSIDMAIVSTKRGPKMGEPAHYQVRQFVYEHNQPFVTTNDVAEAFDSVSRRTINKRLNDLHERGEIRKRHIGPNSVVWYPPD